MYYGIGGLIVLVLAILAILGVVNSGMDSTKKLIWILIILLLPLVGAILWFLIGSKSGV